MKTTQTLTIFALAIGVALSPLPASREREKHPVSLAELASVLNDAADRLDPPTTPSMRDFNPQTPKQLAKRMRGIAVELNGLEVER